MTPLVNQGKAAVEVGTEAMDKAEDRLNIRNAKMLMLILFWRVALPEKASYHADDIADPTTCD